MCWRWKEGNPSTDSVFGWKQQKKKKKKKKKSSTANLTQVIIIDPNDDFKKGFNEMLFEISL